ncbi:hypothetical protein PS662_04374 [Pseudomonas fluorescens]|uniref:DUF4055 domain-containing protein n=1 Tax=Pseudomonas fluorescens TaxID=294 RepID=A0A5E6VYS5_PSEFL|nr:DUF4055 domain-containing protein [Pseudomonas fluorescens]VVN21146.1 hypothetical protein PS662_04374 [Pseudomonas fluorescens]
MANYSDTRKEYADALPGWLLVKRCVAGAREIRKHDDYLPQPDPENKSPENQSRYKQYKKRAMFLNVTGRTRTGLLGAVFRKTAELTIPTGVDYLKENASGDGTSLEQLSKEAVGECLDTGRGGFLVDFPTVVAESGVSSMADLATKRALIHFYDALSVIDWDEQVIDGVKRLIYVNLQERVTEFDPAELSRETYNQNRVLLLIDGVYYQRVYKEGEADYTEAQPTDKSGQPFDHIPFSFFGSQNNDASIDKAPLEDLADVNILHYGNSATVEESGFISSQPTLFITTDIDPDSFIKLNPNGMHIGSTRGYNLGKSGTATLVQADESQLARTLMKDKEEQMLMIGARIVQQGGGAETAEAVRIRYSSDNSVLSTIAGNVSEALKRAILDAERFMIGEFDEKGTVFWLNQSFFDETMTAQDILAQVQLWQQGFIAKSDVRTNLRQGGVLEADRTDDKIDQELADAPPVGGNDE